MTVEPDDADDFDAIVDDDDDDDYTPPTREEHARMQRALTKANAEAKKNRLKLKEFLKPGGKPATEGKEGDKDKEIDRERIRNEVTEVEETRWKKRVVRQAAKAALLEAGLQGDATKLARLVNEDDVDVDDDGEISDGLEEQVEAIKEDYPDLFEDKNAPSKNTRRTRIDGGNRERPPQRKLSSAEKIQAQALKTTRTRR